MVVIVVGCANDGSLEVVVVLEVVLVVVNGGSV